MKSIDFCSIIVDQNWWPAGYYYPKMGEGSIAAEYPLLLQYNNGIVIAVFHVKIKPYDEKV